MVDVTTGGTALGTVGTTGAEGAAGTSGAAGASGTAGVGAVGLLALVALGALVGLAALVALAGLAPLVGDERSRQWLRPVFSSSPVSFIRCRLDCSVGNGLSEPGAASCRCR